MLARLLAPTCVLALLPLVACTPGPKGEATSASASESESDTDTSTETETETETDTEGPAPIDLCPDSPAPPAFAPIDSGVTRSRVGACGHVLYVRGDALVLTTPDLALAEVVDGDPVLGKFSATGHLVAWEKGDGVTIRDLRDASERHEPGVSAYGFVPSADPTIGARLWACKAGVLGVVDLDAGFQALDDAAACDLDTIVAASAGPIVVYGAEGDQLRAVDVDAGEVVTLDVEYRHQYGGDGSRVDELEVSADGALVVHDRIWIELPPDIDTDLPHFEGSTLLSTASGAAMKASVDGFGLLEASIPGRPLVLRGPGAAWVVDATLAITPLDAGLTPRRLLDDHLRLLAHDGAGLGLHDLETHGWSPWIPGATDLGSAFGLSRDQGSLAARVDTAACVDNPNTGECSLVVSELHLARGGATSVLAPFVRGLDAIAVSDHGAVLASVGLLTAPPPAATITDGVFLFGADGALLAQWLAEPGAPRVRGLRVAGDRFVAAIQSVDGTSLEHIDAVTGAVTTLIPAVSYDLELDLYGGGARALFLDRAAQTLHAGALP